MTQIAKVSKAGLLAAVAVLAIAPSALAAEPPPRTSPLVQSVVECRAIADAGQRLACFDAAVAKMAEAEGKGDLVTLDREQRRDVRRQAFGLTLPSLSIFDRGEKPEEADRATFTVKQAWRGKDGKWVFRLETGAVWRQIDDNYLTHDPHDGSVADIRKAALGSFVMKVDGQLALRVHRDN